MCLFTCRSYEAPSPDHRAIADSVSSLVTAVQNSLRHGCVRNCMFVISFRCDVFNFLFSGKGSLIHGKKGRYYSEADFDPTYFYVNWFVSYVTRFWKTRNIAQDVILSKTTICVNE